MIRAKNYYTMNNPKSYNNDRTKLVPATVSISMQSIQQIFYTTEYLIGESIGNGSFGEVYKCVRSNNSNDLVAIKFEKQSNPFRQLRHEYKVNITCHLIFYFSTNFELMVVDIVSLFWFWLIGLSGIERRRWHTECTLFWCNRRI